MTARLEELAARAALLGFTLLRSHEDRHHPELNPEVVCFALRKAGSSVDVRVGSLANLVRLLDALEEPAA